MAGDGAWAEAGSGDTQTPGAAGGGGPRPVPDWAGGLPELVLEKVARTLVAQREAHWAARLKEGGLSEEVIQVMMAWRKRKGNCLFVFARVCKNWRKAQLKVGGPLHTRVKSDVVLPGSVALAKWALAEGCPREAEDGNYNMAYCAAEYGHLELLKWLCGEGGFAMDEAVMEDAAFSGNLELVRWLRGEGCPWTAETRDWAATELGYTDDLLNKVG